MVIVDALVQLPAVVVPGSVVPVQVNFVFDADLSHWLRVCLTALVLAAVAVADHSFVAAAFVQLIFVAQCDRDLAATASDQC